MKAPEPLIVAKPKTIAQRRRNQEVIALFNANHTDNFFQDKGAPPSKKREQSDKRVPTAAPAELEMATRKADDIANDLFMSDSENDVSIHSAHTPIGNYFNRSRGGSQTGSVADGSGNEPEAEDVGPKISYIHHKLKERNSRAAKRSIPFQSPKGTLPAKPSILKKGGKKCQIEIMPAAISNLMQERERRMEEGEDEEERGYDSCDEGSTAASSIINPPSSLLDDYRRERSRFKF